MLTENGWRQMRQAVGLDNDFLPAPVIPGWTHLVSSPLLRCQEFAVKVGKTTGLDVAVIEDWQEIDYGDWDGMPAVEWRKIAADQFRAFRDDLSALAPPNGETFLQFRDRVLTAWKQLSEYQDGAHILLVTHGGVMRVLLPTVLGMPLNRSFPLHIPFACFSRVVVEVRDDKAHASLIFHNGAGHDSFTE